jgi:hypothetical protein
MQLRLLWQVTTRSDLPKLSPQDFLLTTWYYAFSNPQITGKSFVILAIETDAFTCLQYLIDNKANTKQPDVSFFDFLFHSFSFWRFSVLHRTPLHIAVVLGKMQSLSLLLNANVDVSLVDGDGVSFFCIGLHFIGQYN